MRSLLIGLLLVSIIAPMASAELLVTALPFGKGKWVIEGAGVQSANVMNVSGMAATTLGAYLGYGINEKLDLIVSAGQSNVTGMAGAYVGVSAIRATGYGLNLKYALASAGDNSPVDVSIGAGYKLLTQVTSITGLGDMTANGNHMLLGIGISKIMVPFVPYAGLTYRATGYEANATQTQFDWTVGTAIAWSQQGAVFLEDTMQVITPVGGGDGYSSNQLAIAVGYTI